MGHPDTFRTTHLPEQIQVELTESRLALLGAFQILQEAHEVITSTRPGRTAQAELEYESMARVIAKTFLRHQDFGLLNEFFAINGSLHDLPIAEVPVLFDALAIGYEMALQEHLPSPETQVTNHYIATAGLNNSGKGTITTFLKDLGFLAYPLSDRIREMAAAYGHQPPHDRSTLLGVGNHARATYGAAVLIRSAVRVFSETGHDNKLLFDGLRTTAEAQEFLDLAQTDAKVTLIAISTGQEGKSDQRIRFQRALHRGSSKDPTKDTPKAFAAFCVTDERERDGILKVMAMAHVTIINADNQQAHTRAQLETLKQQISL